MLLRTVIFQTMVNKLWMGGEKLLYYFSGLTADSEGERPEFAAMIRASPEILQGKKGHARNVSSAA